MAFSLLQGFTFSGDGKKSPTNWTKGDQIGCGMFSKVYLASVESPTGPFEMVVKQIKTTPESKIKYEKSALTEINVMRNLSHKRIVTYYGFCSKAFSFYVFMEHVRYGSLSAFLLGNGPMADAFVKKFTRQILKGLQYLHSKRMIHRDIKSGNVLLFDYDNIKLADFGVSKMFDEISKAYTTDVGTIKYMAPEMIKNESHSYPVDIWAVGCVVLEMATGKEPFENCQYRAQVYGILMGEDPSPMQASNAHLSQEMESFLSKIFCKKPTRRPTCSDLLKDLFFQGNDHKTVNGLNEVMRKSVRNPSESDDDNKSEKEHQEWLDTWRNDSKDSEIGIDFDDESFNWDDGSFWVSDL